MPKTFTYNRPSATLVVSTGMVLTLKTAETPNAPAAVAGGGTDGVLDARFQVDADESGGTDVQDLFKILATPNIDTNGQITLTVVVTPIKGGGANGTADSIVVTHDESMDTWQTNAGRARQ
jgi:hypothetical protein